MTNNTTKRNTTTTYVEDTFVFDTVMEDTVVSISTEDALELVDLVDVDYTSLDTAIAWEEYSLMFI